MVSYKRKADLAKTAQWGVTATWIGYPVAKMFWLIAFGGFTGMIVLEVLVLTAVCAVVSSMLGKKQEELQIEHQKTLPPHKYDSNVLYWEEGDSVKIWHEEDDHYVTFDFVGFTDDNTVVFREEGYNTDSLHEVVLPELHNYKNTAAAERKDEDNWKKLKAKVEDSFYNEKLNELRELRNEQKQLVEDIGT
jgi:hypothetical protein